MPIESRCRGCGKMLRVADEHAGKQARCPQCGYVYTVGASSSPFPTSVQERPIAGPGDVGASNSVEEVDEIEIEQDLPSQSSGGGLPSGGSSSGGDVGDAWYMKTPEGQIYGPVGRRQLDNWVAEGRVTDDCQIRQGEYGQWQAAASVFSVLAAPRPGPTSSSGSGYGGAYRGPSTQGHGQAHRPSQATHLQPHRGGLVLTLAILGWVLSCLMPISLALSIVAVILATEDIRKMRSGLMDPSGLGTTQASQIIAAIQIGLSVLSLVGCCFWTIVADL